MKSKRRAIFLSVMVLSIAAGTLPPGSQLAQRFVLAQSSKSSSESQPTKWEYCAITDSEYYWDKGGNVNAIVRICHFRGSGCLEEKVEFVLDKTTPIITSLPEQAHDNAMSKAISKLSDEGWEMVVAGPFYFGSSKTQALYFRRSRS